MANVGKIKQIIGAVIDVSLMAHFLKFIMHWN